MDAKKIAVLVVLLETIEQSLKQIRELEPLVRSFRELLEQELPTQE